MIRGRMVVASRRFLQNRRFGPTSSSRLFDVGRSDSCPGVPSLRYALRFVGTAAPLGSSAATSGSHPAPSAAIPFVSEEDQKLIPRPSTFTASEVPQAPSPADTVAAADPAVAAAEMPADSVGVAPACAEAPATEYTEWELKALILPLIPIRGTIKLSTLLGLLPDPAANILIGYRGGGAAAYIRQHLTKEVVTVYGDQLARITQPASPASAAHRVTAVRQHPVDLEPPAFAPLFQSHSLEQRPQPTPRNSSDIMDMLVEYIPTYFVNLTLISDQLPPDITRHFAGSTLFFFIKRFRHQIDVRTQHANTEVRLRPDYAHPKRGVADSKYSSGASGQQISATLRRPPRNSEANLIMFLIPKVPTVYTPLAEVLQEVTGMVSRHPSFDPRLGIIGLLEKYPEYFQIVDGKIRIRPYRSAPNSIDDLDAASSPLPRVFAKMMDAMNAAHEGPPSSDPAAHVQGSAVSTGRLFALLTNDEKKTVKATCRSFPRFLRMHGAELVVSTDNMKTRKFIAEQEPCAETVAHQVFSSSSVSPNDPIMRIPAEMDESTNADWAVKELYDALPLMQCAELDEVLVLVQPAVRNALPKGDQLVNLLAQYKDYFLLWPYPDDASITVIQRAKIELPQLENDDIIRMVLPLIPQGGIDAEKLLRRAPLLLQRHFYRYGIKKVMGGIKEFFLVAGERIIRVG